jgi:enoyl-CoA hydratase/carnithine racemase
VPETVLYEKRDRLAFVTLNRPNAKNAIDQEMHAALCRIWRDFRDDDEVDIAILSGAGDAYRVLQCNLVTKVVPHDQLLAETEIVASQMLRNSQRALRSAKETILEVLGKPLDDQLRIEAWNSYTCLDRDQAAGLLQEFYDKSDTGRTAGIRAPDPHEDH